MVRLYFLTLYFLLGTFVFNAQNQPPCSDFNNASSPAGNWAPAPYPNGMVNASFGNPNSLDGSQYLILSDLSGSSWYVNDQDYKFLGERFAGQCLYFDFYLKSDGGYGAPVHPRITLSNGTNSITFLASVTVTPGSGWVRVKAPIAAATSSALPGNSDGSWTMDPGMTWNDFNAVMYGSTMVMLSPDYTSSPSETVLYDNICVRSCENCGGCNSNFKLQMTTSTSGSYTTGQVFLESTNAPDFYKVNWGDGTTGDVMTSHTYTGNGSYTICVTQFENGKPKCTTCLQICIPKPADGGSGKKQEPMRSPMKEIADAAKGEKAPVVDKGFILVPNPARNYVEIKMNNDKKSSVSVTVTDASGKAVIQSTETIDGGPQSLILNTEKLIRGIYTVEVTSEQAVYQQKLMISK